MSTSSRKSKRNLVASAPQEPVLRAATGSVLMPQRLIYRLLTATVRKLVAQPDDARRFFSSFFDAAMGDAERNEFTNAFLRNPPKTILGFARSAASMPCYAVVSNEEHETETFLADDIGSDGTFEYKGSHWDETITVFTYSEHPDTALMLYHVSKAILLAGRSLLEHEGIVEFSCSGGELQPDENYMPENLFSRALRVSVKYPLNVPKFLDADPAKLAVLIYACDVTVDGIQGGVHPYAVVDDG